VSEQTTHNLTPLTAEFLSPELELQYRQTFFGEALEETRMALFISGGFYLALVISDFLTIGSGQGLLYCFLIRAAVVLSWTSFFFTIKRIGTPRGMDVIAILSTGVITISETVLILVKGQSIFHHGIIIIVAVLAFYLFVPFRLINKLASGIILSTVFLAAALVFLEPNFDEFMLTALLLSCINFFGATNQHAQNIRSRQAFLNFRALNAEITDRVGAEKLLRQSENSLDEVFRAAPSPLLVVDIESGDLKLGNIASAELLSIPFDHLNTYNADDFGLDHEVRGNLFKHSKGPGRHTPVDLPIQNLHEEQIVASFRCSSIIFRSSNCILLNATDVTEHRKRTDILKEISEGFTGLTGQDFLEALTVFLHKTVGCEWALVGRIGNDGASIQSLAFNNQGTIAESIEYDLKGSPCEKVVGEKVCVFENGVAHLFPDDHMLRERGAESYAGAPLFDSNRDPIGLIAVLGTKPIKDPETISYLLQILAGRAGK